MIDSCHWIIHVTQLVFFKTFDVGWRIWWYDGAYLPTRRLTQRKPTRETDRAYILPEPCSQVAGEISIEATGEITPWRVSQAQMAENTNPRYVESIRSSLPMCSLTRWGCFSAVRPLKMMSACWLPRRPMALLTPLAVIQTFQFVNHTAVSKRDRCRGSDQQPIVFDGAVAYILIGISGSFTIPADICRLSLASTCCPDSDEASQVCLRVAQTDYLDLKIIYCILFGFASCFHLEWIAPLMWQNIYWNGVQKFTKHVVGPAKDVCIWCVYMYVHIIIS